MARRRRRRGSFTSHHRRGRRATSRRRRSSSGGGLGRRVGGFVPAGTISAVVGSAVGFAGVNIAMKKAPYLKTLTGNGRIAAKAGVAVAAAFVLRKARMHSMAKGVLVGGLTAVALDVVNKVAPPAWAPGLTGMNGYGAIDANPYFGYGNPPLGEYVETGYAEI